MTGLLYGIVEKTKKETMEEAKKKLKKKEEKLFRICLRSLLQKNR